MNNNNAEDNQSGANLMESDGEDTPQQPEQQRDDVPATENSTPAPAPPTRQPVVIGLQSASRMNKKLYSLFITKRYQECKEAIEEHLLLEPEALCEYAILLRAQIAREEGQVRECLGWLNRALKHNPKSSKILYQVGRARFLLGEHQKAIDNFAKSIQHDPNDWKPYYWQSMSYYHLESGDSGGALNKAQEVLLSCPRMNKSVEILVFLAKLCTQRNDILPAIEAYKRALEIEPENLDIISRLGLLYLKTNSETKAFSCLGKALTFDPTHVPTILAASTVLQNNGDYDVALSKYRVAADKCDYNGPLWNNIGMCFFGKGKLVAAIGCLKKANYLSPLDWKVLYNLAVVHYAMQQYASAYHFIAAALNLQPSNPLLLMTLAIILTELEDADNARKAYQRGAQIDPNCLALRVNLGIFEYRHGNVDAAKEWLGDLFDNPVPDSPQYTELNLLVSRLKGCLKKFTESSTQDEA
uniref:Bardet-Biedl syndrome 4 protein n=1 Tax=Acrobeloides nanus TaxID=290746 RepID=A0A914D8K3_9BILA